MEHFISARGAINAVIYDLQTRLTDLDDPRMARLPMGELTGSEIAAQKAEIGALLDAAHRGDKKTLGEWLSEQRDFWLGLAENALNPNSRAICGDHSATYQNVLDLIGYKSSV